MNTHQLPLLYTFRRCPFAIRARMAVFYADIKIILQEVSLKNKPQAMLDLSPKGTVPVLWVDGKVIDESLDIMLWALEISDPDGWCSKCSEEDIRNSIMLIDENDTDFKIWLDRYKYADRFPEKPATFYREQCEYFLQKLDDTLKHQPYLFGPDITFADIAIFPFIRQFSMVDKNWFENSAYPDLRNWLNSIVGLPLFSRVMSKALTG